MARRGLAVIALLLSCGTSESPAPPKPTAPPPAAVLAKPGLPLAPLPPRKSVPPPHDPAMMLVGADDVTCAMLTSGAVACWGGAFTTPHRIAGWTDVAKLVALGPTLCALHRDGHVDCGTAPPTLTADSATLPLRRIGGVTFAIDLAASGDVMCALEKSGDVGCRVDGPSMTRTHIHHASSLRMAILEAPDFRFPSVSSACAIASHGYECISVYLQVEETEPDPGEPFDAHVAKFGTKPKLVISEPRVASPEGPSPPISKTGAALVPDLRPETGDTNGPHCEQTATSTVCSFLGSQVTVKLDRIAQLVGDWNHVCALYGDGAVACTGNDEHGQLGDGGGDVATPNTTPAWGLDDAIDIVAWSSGTVALRANGQLAYWGTGDPERAEMTVQPTTYSDVSDATRLVAGHSHACILRRGGTVACWGGKSVPVISNKRPTDVPGLADIRDLSATDFGILARTAGGTLLHVGDPQLGANAATSPMAIKGAERAAAIVIAGRWICVLDQSPGSVRCWIENEHATSQPITVATGVVEIAGSGTAFTERTPNAKLVARLADGRAVVIELALDGDLPVVATNSLASGTRSLFTSESTVCARGANGTSCITAGGNEPPTIPRAYDNARALTERCALTQARVVICFDATFGDGTGRGDSNVPVPVALP